jgi:RNA polymerase-binding transcription factor DksA
VIVLTVIIKSYFCQPENLNRGKKVNKVPKKTGSKNDSAAAITLQSKPKAEHLQEPVSEAKSTANNLEMPTTQTKPENSLSEQKEKVFRYSDEELNEFRTLIMERLEVAREELMFLQGQMLGKHPSGEEDSSDLRLSLEDGSGAMDREQLSQLTSRQVMYISNLEKALIRIHNKTYGVCRETGKLIDKARLRAVPHATLSIEAKNAASKK